MKYTLLLLVVCGFALPTHAADQFNYKAVTALAAQRLQLTPEAFQKNGNILLLGPEQSVEFDTTNGTEKKRVVPYCRLTSPLCSVGDLANRQLGLQRDFPYQILVYHKDSNTPALRIEGRTDTLALNQYPLVSGDVLVVTNLNTKK
ncbi:MAG: hypothetical protein ABI615_04955 [Chthoniobacterales bacterium]